MTWDRVWDDGRMIIDGDRDHFLSVRMYYDKGDCYRVRRGYYLSVVPVRIDDRGDVRLRSFCPSDGIRFFLKDVTRKSDKAAKSASEIAKNVLPFVVDEVCKRNGIARDSVADLAFD